MGRHREYDADKVLDAALCVFWRKGYEGASSVVEQALSTRPGVGS